MAFPSLYVEAVVVSFPAFFDRFTMQNAMAAPRDTRKHINGDRNFNPPVLLFIAVSVLDIILSNAPRVSDLSIFPPYSVMDVALESLILFFALPAVHR